MSKSMPDALERMLSSQEHTRIIPDRVIPESLLRGEGGTEKVLKEACVVIRHKGQVRLTETLIKNHAFLMTMRDESGSATISQVEGTVTRTAIIRPRANLILRDSLAGRLIAWEAMRSPVKRTCNLSLDAMQAYLGEPREEIEEAVGSAQKLRIIARDGDRISIVHRDWIKWLDAYDPVLIDTRPSDRELALVEATMTATGQKLSWRHTLLYATFLKLFPIISAATENLAIRYGHKKPPPEQPKAEAKAASAAPEPTEVRFAYRELVSMKDILDRLDSLNNPRKLH